MGNRANVPKVNAGSMADIAFLLLIFFLVTTSIESEVGLVRKLPKVDDAGVVADVYERNILRILIDNNGNLLVEDAPVELTEVQDLAKEFLDNGGMSSDLEGYCSYCKGKKDPKSSDNPDKAIIALSTQRQTEYGVYIAVQNKLMAAYNQLRNRESQRLFKTDYTIIEKMYEGEGLPLIEKEDLKKKIMRIRSLFPLKITEVQTKE